MAIMRAIVITETYLLVRVQNWWSSCFSLVKKEKGGTDSELCKSSSV